MSYKDLLRASGSHSLNPEIIHLYYGHLYKDTVEGPTYYAAGLIKGCYYIYSLDNKIPDGLDTTAKLKLHTPDVLENYSGKSNKMPEVVYRLSDLSDWKAWKKEGETDKQTKKRFYNNTKRNANAMVNGGWFVIDRENDPCLPTEEAFPHALDMFNLWEKQKLAKPDLHRISFGRKRYKRSIMHGYNYPHVGPAKVRIFECWSGRDPKTGLGIPPMVAIRAVMVWQDFAYELCCLPNHEIGKRLSNAFNYHTLMILAKEGYKQFNTGYASGKLLAYKNHFPHRYLSVVWTPVGYLSDGSEELGDDG